MPTLALAVIVISGVVLLALTYGRVAARRAERHVGAWAWLVYAGLGAGMVFGAMSIQQPVLSAFMWTKLSAFILTGLWLAQGRVRRHEPLFPGVRGASNAVIE
jgi:multisubunit Na+/H+ antiporter MnhB subunit